MRIVSKDLNFRILSENASPSRGQNFKFAFRYVTCGSMMETTLLHHLIKIVSFVIFCHFGQLDSPYTLLSWLLLILYVIYPGVDSVQYSFSTGSILYPPFRDKDVG